MNTESDELGTSDVASEVLGIIFSITEFGVLGKVERDGDGVVGDLVRVGDLDVVGSERRVETEVGAEVEQRKINGGGSVGDGNTDDRVGPLEVVDLWREVSRIKVSWWTITPPNLHDVSR